MRDSQTDLPPVIVVLETHTVTSVQLDRHISSTVGLWVDRVVKVNCELDSHPRESTAILAQRGEPFLVHVSIARRSYATSRLRAEWIIA